MDHMGDEPAMSVDFLTGEYARQLLRDGASVVFGVILSITEDEYGMYVLKVGEREYVESASHPGGYYIADKNLESSYYLPPDARATFISRGSNQTKAMVAEEFVLAAEQDMEKLFDIYIMGDYIELLIARYTQ